MLKVVLSIGSTQDLCALATIIETGTKRRTEASRKQPRGAFHYFNLGS